MKSFLVKNICAHLLLRKYRNRRRERTMYVRKLFSTRRTEGEMMLLKHLEEDIFYHHKYYRMNTENLELLMCMVGDKILHAPNHKLSITPKQRLVLTLRYLATGNSQISLAFSHRISPSSLSIIIPEVLDAICTSLQPIHLPSSTVDRWKTVAEDFFMKWNIPNCVGAIDGKHVRIKCPQNSGSHYYNYKKYFSIVLMAIADARYKFTFIDVGAYGSEGDSTIFSKSTLGRSLDTGSMQLPPPTPFVGIDGRQVQLQNYPHVFVADDAFPLKPYIMRPFGGSGLTYEQKVFNYRLSRARRVIENSFGILAAKFRVFHTSINARPEVVDKIIWTACCLHNFLIDRQGLEFGLADTEHLGEIINGGWREETASDDGLFNIGRLGSNNYNNDSRIIRHSFMEYFLSNSGKLSWQDERVNKGISIPSSK